MTMKKAARMDSSLIARKGQAVPTHIATENEADEKGGIIGDATVESVQTPPNGATKSLTVKLDAVRYKALRQLGVDEDRTHQDIMVAALDAYLNLRGNG